MALTNFFTRINSEVNSLVAARRNAEDKLNKKKKNFNDKKTKFLDFLLELITILGVVDPIIDSINNFLAKGQFYESKLKQILIECFNANIACNLDDIFQPNEVENLNNLTNTNNPINRPYFAMKINRMDFFGILKVDPNTPAGTVLYGSPAENSLNRAIKSAIDNPTTAVSWKNIVGIRLDPTDQTILQFFVSNRYTNLPVSTLVTDLVNNIVLIPKIGLMFNIMNNLYGSFNASIQPTKIDPLSLINKTKLNFYVDRILDGGDDLTIDESFFNFSNEELVDIERITQNLSNNFLEILSCNNAQSVITYNDIFPILNNMLSATTFNEQVTVLNAGMSTLQLSASANVSRLDLPKFKIEFYFKILFEIVKSIVGLIYSPQFLSIMMIYFKLANTNPNNLEPITYTDFKDFLKKTKNILICIVLRVLLIVLLYIVIPIIIKRLIGDANAEKLERSREKYTNYAQQYLALRGTLSTIKSSDLIKQMVSSL